MRHLLLIVLLALVAIGNGLVAHGQGMVGFTPSRDTTIYEENTDFANGGEVNLFSGLTVGDDERRVLMAFDLTPIPTDATITEVRLDLTMTRTQAGPVTFSLHALSADWGEGTATGQGGGGGGGGGSMAGTGDATWSHGRFDSQPWNQPGADFDPQPLSQVEFNDPGVYTFPSTPDLVAQVQAWVQGSQPNHGFALLADPTLNAPTSKRFSSRENPTVESRPTLQVTFEGGTPMPVSVSGLWFDPALDGEGYNIIQAAAGTVIFFYGFTADGERLWLVSETASDPITLNGSLILTMFRGTPGSFDLPSPSTELESWGTLEVTLSSCTQGVFLLDGTDGQKTSNVIQLAGIAGSECATAR